jgi:hypothetical protein
MIKINELTGRDFGAHHWLRLAPFLVFTIV